MKNKNQSNKSPKQAKSILKKGSAKKASHRESLLIYAPGGLSGMLGGLIHEAATDCEIH